MALLAVLYWQLDRRSTAAQARLTTDVAASHATILDAAQRSDGELFVSFLSGRDPDWARAQERLVRRGGFIDRSAFDLHWTPAAPVSPTVTLAPDLRAAELTVPQAYVAEIGNGLTETVLLQQTAFYRQGPTAGSIRRPTLTSGVRPRPWATAMCASTTTPMTPTSSSHWRATWTVPWLSFAA